ncbi:protein phosphatase 2C domain-containing protein [Iningainema tapete]|uniref:Protein phosphatase 2C domain-containing protein n=1 Tax=Iningainema tapete BLCC-T55 TaxID=2748662 RepID=A0A8J7C8R6_9CYAN|nr:protein phosphatase 2C domain-containing protein [Iningainema tapete]MBD2777089.1 protein phosphatase 2C domain-containing protein [Iningainema tapete BLCC-T55]
MENDAATLQCPNEQCQAANPLTHNFCQNCRTPLPKRYLWAMGDTKSMGKVDLLGERYLVLKDSVLLDTKPGLAPHIPELDSLEAIKPYLKLFPYRLHVPQVYGVIPISKGQSEQEILLLEKPPLLATDVPTQVELCSDLITAWGDATSMRQLNWLWQVANIWQPLKSEGVATSLLDTRLLRVEGSLVRLLELRNDENSPELPELGEFWQQLVSKAKPAIADFVKEICRCLIYKEIDSGEQLVTILDQGLASVGQQQKTTIHIATKSDTGPSRQRNEDACYPASGSSITKPPSSSALAIVCDGIGGHEGGNVASSLAIDSITQQLSQLTKLSHDHLEPTSVLLDLEQAAAVANDKISQRNDNEHRQGRQRMGTTVVLALPIAHEMYVAHVGDSRAYWITKSGCYQVTLDDDVASREVRLGYAVYREAVQQGASGSLVQALGMSPSSSLHPTAGRYILDEDCVFLLCSDGLSDFDRVEQYWETHILPILTDKVNISNVVKELVELANNLNGHDNVTIALVHYQIKYVEPKSAIKAVWTQPTTPKTPSLVGVGTKEHRTYQKTQVVTTNKPTSAKLPLQLIILCILVMAGGVLGFLWGQRLQLFSKTNPVLSTTTSPSVTTTNTPPAEQAQLFQIKSDTPAEVVLSKANLPISIKKGTVPQGSVLLLLSNEPAQTPEQKNLVQLRVCTIGKSTILAAKGNLSLSVGDEVRIPFTTFQKLNNFVNDDVAKKCSLQPRQSSPTQSQKATPTRNTSQQDLKTDLIGNKLKEHR